MDRRKLVMGGGAAAAVAALASVPGGGIARAAAPTVGALGRVSVRASQIVARPDGDGLELLYVPDDRYVRLDASGTAIWKRIVGGEGEIGNLIEAHAAAHGLAPAVASHQVLTFLDELRAQRFLHYELPAERHAAPLLDATLVPARWGTVRAAQAIDVPDTPQRLADLNDPDSSLTILDVQQIADSITTDTSAGVSQAITVTTDKPDLSTADIQALVDGQDAAGVSVLTTVNGPNPDATLRDVVEGGLPQPDGGVAPGLVSSIGGVVIIIRWGPWVIVIIIIWSPTGPGGKSRQACKTMCV